MPDDAGLELVQIDAFTDRPFHGNPAAVCRLAEPRDDAFLQSVAAEMNLSETAFLSRRDDGGWDLRWFTPAIEVDLCGHATLASAHHLWQDGHAGEDEEIRFHTHSGVLTARRADGWIELDFPSLPPKPMGALPGLAAALGEELLWVGGNGSDLLVELASEAAVRNRCPDMAALRRLPARGVIVTAPAAAADGGYDFVSRFFAPAVGVDEDPVTGSAHCCLGPFWAERLGRDQVVGYQASARGGTVRVRVAGDRVVLAGRAVTVLRARLAIP
jgi:predicted PhzF superfamily epimerase YddE/YHI9